MLKAVNLPFSVPQGSLLGAPLYCKYTNPVGHIVRLFHILFHGYADDSQLYKSINPSKDNQHQIFDQLQKCIFKIISWMSANKLKINDTKTEFMIIVLGKQLQKITTKELKLDTAIPNSSSVRNLGAHLDEHMTMKTHVNSIVKACNFHLRNFKSILNSICLQNFSTLSYYLSLRLL